jgi:hypothetical protein
MTHTVSKVYSYLILLLNINFNGMFNFGYTLLILLLGVYFLSSKTTQRLMPLKRTSEICSCYIESRSHKTEVNHMLFSPIF